jgi:hypothetical protein
MPQNGNRFAIKILAAQSWNQTAMSTILKLRAATDPPISPAQSGATGNFYNRLEPHRGRVS